MIVDLTFSPFFCGSEGKLTVNVVWSKSVSSQFIYIYCRQCIYYQVLKYTQSTFSIIPSNKFS